MTTRTMIAEFILAAYAGSADDDNLVFDDVLLFV